MRLPISALLMAILMPLAQGVAAQDDGDVSMASVREEMKSLSQGLADSNADQREGLMADIEDVLAAVDSRVAILDSRLQENWDKADRLARVQAQTAVASLRRERARALEWNQRMKDSSNLTWESMKDGFDDVFDDLSDAWKSAEQNVRKAVEED